MRSPWRNFWIAVLLLAAAAPLPSVLTSQRGIPLQRPLSQLDYEIGDWRGRDQSLSERVRAVLGTDDILLRQYAGPTGGAVGLYVSYFPQQGQGKTSHSPKHCLPGSGWQPLRTSRIDYPVAGAATAQINEILYEKEGRLQLVYYWFRERQRILASEYSVKWYLIWDALTRQRTDGALLRVSAPITKSEERARQQSLDFMRRAIPRVNELLPG